MKKGIYRHYKGKLYLVDKVVRHSETEEEMVIYQCRYEDENGEMSWWARPKDMFLGKVEVEGRLLRRFEYVGNSQYMYC
jgi:hypothetical protein